MKVIDSLSNYARIEAIDYYLPKGELSNKDIEAQFPEWSVAKVSEKTGIHTRHIASVDEFTSDLATNAALQLFRSSGLTASDFDFLILCTQSPDYFLPTTACLVQERIGMPTDSGALDINPGCSGYIYGLSLAKAMVESGQAKRILLITGDTYSKFLNDSDKSVRTIFGDGASASSIVGDSLEPKIYAPVFGTDGSGSTNLIVPNGGLKDASLEAPKAAPENREIEATDYNLFMDGPQIFNFTIKIVPETVEKILEKASIQLEEIDYFVFHQANRFMLEHLRTKVGIPAEKFLIFMEETGNTVSSTIPIALSHYMKNNQIQSGSKIMLLGFGVGLSWGGLIAEF